MIDFKGKIIVIAGPSASGKSNIALKLAKDIGGYIVNGDSRQLYTDLNIGTAKPKFDKKISDGKHILDGITHYLYDFVNPKSNYTLFEYQQDVEKVLQSENGIPILVGGTGLYIDSVIFNYDLVENTSIQNDLDSKSVGELQDIAGNLITDMNESDGNNRHRLIRVIERGGVNRKRGKELDNIYFVLDIDKQILEKNVKKRIDMMFKEGLLEENISLIDRGYTYDDKGMNSIGYMEFKEYFENKISIEDVKEKIFKNTMSYIKRQKTWFRRNNRSIWSNSYDEIYQRSKAFLTTN